VTIELQRTLENHEDVEALETVPYDKQISAQGTYELFSEVARKLTNKIAVSFMPTGSPEEPTEDLTFNQLLGRINQTANMFYDLGINSKDVVSFLLPNLIQSQLCLWGGEAAGIANPINFLLKPKVIADLMNAAGTKVLVALGPSGHFDIWQKVEKLRKLVPTLQFIFQVSGQGDEKNGIYVFDEYIEKYSAESLDSKRLFNREEIASYFHTGGTTGSPKLAQHTHGNEIYEAWATVHSLGYTSSDVYLNGLPVFHVIGAILNALSPLSAGARMVILTPGGYRNPKVVENHWKIVERFKATGTGSVPTTYGTLLNVPVGNCKINSMDACFVGGSIVPVELQKAFERQFHIPLLNGYGMTEAGAQVAMNFRKGKGKYGSVGIRLPYEEIKVVEIGTENDTSIECDHGETGVVVVRGPNVFPGYLNETMNEGMFTKDGWLITGDLGYLERDGFLTLTGRAKDLIIRSGHNIDPLLIEQAVEQHPDVEMAASVGKPDAYAGELPVVYVKLRPGKTVSSEDLMAFVKDHIDERPAMPKEIIFLDEMPLTAVGKVFKPKLRWEQVEKVFSTQLAFLKEKGLSVKVRILEDRKHGMVANISIFGLVPEKRFETEMEIKEVLGQYTTPHVVEWV